MRDEFSERNCMKIFKAILCRNTLKKVLLQFNYSTLYPKLKQLDKIRYSRPIGKWTFDACEKDIPHKLGYKKKYRNYHLLASTSRVLCPWGYWCNFVKWLPKCGESYARTYEEQLGGDIISENMLRANEPGDILHPFIATDVATESNPDNVRDAIVTGIMKSNKIPMENPIYKSPLTGNTFDLREFTLDVCTSFFILYDPYQLT